MIIVRQHNERGRTTWPWLDSYHTFSFGDYHDPSHMSFRSLRVINEDFIQPDQGFGMHPHKNMEIVTYVVQGALEHKDSLGTGSVIRPGDIQRMSAGTGIFHSEFNPSKKESVHLLQIWIMPDKNGHPPSYEQKTFRDTLKAGELKLIASPDGHDDSVTLHQNVNLFTAELEPGNKVNHDIAQNRHAWIQLIHGKIRVNGLTLNPGDAAAVSDEKNISIESLEKAEFLLFDLA